MRGLVTLDVCVRLRVQMQLTVRGRTCSAGERAFNRKRVLSVDRPGRL